MSLNPQHAYEVLGLESYPLSPMQKGLLFHHLEAPTPGAYIQQVTIELREELDLPLFRKAWQELIDRHAVLSTSFHWKAAGPPLQRVDSGLVVPWEEHDWSALPASQRDDQLAQFLVTDLQRGFDMTQAPLLRLSLFRKDENEFSVVWTFHHILVDGRSRLLLLQEVFARYEASKRGSSLELPQPRPYSDHIRWLEACDFESTEPYWRQLFDGFLPAAPLNLGGPRALSPEVFSRSYQEDRLSPSTTAALETFARQNQLTLNTLIQGAWAFLLSRYSGTDDVVFGATRACRKSALENSESMIGLLINTLPVRLKIRGRDTVMDCLKAMRTQWVSLREHEHTPLSRVQGWSDVPSGQPLFETIVVFENFQLEAKLRELGEEWKSRSVHLRQHTHYPLTLEAYAEPSLLLRIDYAADRFDEASVSRMLGHLKELLAEMMARPDVHPGKLRLLTSFEEQELLEQGNPLGQPSMIPFDGDATLHELFEERVKQAPDSPAVTCDQVSITFGELSTRASALAHHLRELGVGPDVIVGLCMERSIDLVVALVAILKAGGAYLPIDLAYPKDRLAFMLDDSQAPVLLTQTNLLASLPSTSARVVCVDSPDAILPSLPVTHDREALASPDNLAYVIYTSGTTGKPKGALISHRNVARLLSATDSWYRFSERDVWTFFHSHAFDFSVWEIWGALLFGGRLVVVPYLVSRSPEAFYRLLSSERVTILNQTPSAFYQLIQAEETIGQKDLALRYVIFGGEALEMQALRPWYERHGDQPKLVNMYGITETTVHVTYRPLSQNDLNSGSVIGVPISDLQVYILDANRQPTPIGVAGEMYVGGSGLARGYLDRAELTAERFIPNPFGHEPGGRLYKTGDLARFLPGLDIEYLGRIDHQVKIRGFRIELGEIESVLCQHPSVREAAVLAREDVPGEKRLVGYVVQREPITASELRNHLKRLVPEYMVPAAFVILDKLPLTSNSKVDRKVLPAPEQERPDLDARYVAPSTAIQAQLAAIWAKVLRLEHVGINDNFFELGGDSILSIQVIAQARQAGLTLTPRLLFRHQTIAELAGFVLQNDATEADQRTARGDVPLTPIEHWFFEQELTDPHHFNQAFIFALKEPLEAGLVRSALQQVELHHDALRLRFRKDAAGWHQEYVLPREQVSFEQVDLSALSEPGFHTGMFEAARRCQASLDLAQGPLWRVIHFKMPATYADRLLIVIHHLAVDGVSWRILLEDFESAYNQLKQGQKVRLPAKTSSFQQWALKLAEYSFAGELQAELDYWRHVTGSSSARLPLDHVGPHSRQILERSSTTIKVRLEASETQLLLQQVPAVYRTQINDVLLTALALAFREWTGSDEFYTNLEGHGREDIVEGVDLSRTIGWFTSIFPIRLRLDSRSPGPALKSVKEQLRQIPQKGIGYGILRYLAGHSELSSEADPEVLFNYLGQIDRMVQDSQLLSLAPESSGPWHSPLQRRRHAMEINSLVIDGQLEVWWTYSERLHKADTIQNLGQSFVSALRSLIAHCQSPDAGGHTPSDFPLSGLDQEMLDRFLHNTRGIQDLYPLSPMQMLFFTLGSVQPASILDQWHGTLQGNLDVGAFQRSWELVFERHAILRSTFHDEALPEPLQMVHQRVSLPWKVEDWSELPEIQQMEEFAAFLKTDREEGFQLNTAPLTRLALIRLSDDTFKFVWSVSALLLDGWSWPLVFRDLSRIYESLQRQQHPELEPPRLYRDYLRWLRAQNPAAAKAYWASTLRGFREPTRLPGPTRENWNGTERFGRQQVDIDPGLTGQLQSAARNLHVTLNTFVQSVWSLLLNRQSGSADVVFGATFSGRPADLDDAEEIVGPFANSLPIRVAVTAGVSLSEFARQLHKQLLELSEFQYSSLLQVQGWSEVPWRERLFESLVVFQNYRVHESARQMGGSVVIGDFEGPIHTNYPMTLLAEPEPDLRITLIYDRSRFSSSLALRWARDLGLLLNRLPALLHEPIETALALLSIPIASVSRPATASLNYAPPQTEMERVVSRIWQEVFHLEQVSVEDNFFELGAHSLLIVRLHARLCEDLELQMPIVRLFEHPSIRALARHIIQPVGQSVESSGMQNRAQRQKEALSRFRRPARRLSQV
jgi:amino acid adenylation domain-containing protein/non-ribosomal peptide synthase protein (TIGR01720 family)